MGGPTEIEVARQEAAEKDREIKNKAVNCPRLT